MEEWSYLLDREGLENFHQPDRVMQVPVKGI